MSTGASKARSTWRGDAPFSTYLHERTPRLHPWPWRRHAEGAQGGLASCSEAGGAWLLVPHLVLPLYSIGIFSRPRGEHFTPRCHVAGSQQTDGSYYGGPRETTCGSSRSCSMTGKPGQQNCWNSTLLPGSGYFPASQHTNQSGWQRDAILDTCALHQVHERRSHTSGARTVCGWLRHAVADLAQIL